MNKLKKMGVLGLAIFALSMVACFGASKVSASASAPKKEYSVKLYKGNANANGFETKTVKIKNLTAYSIIKELKAYGAVASNVKANSLEYKGKYLTLDLSKEFAKDVSSVGTSGEYVKVGSVVNTFIDAFKVDTLTITVDGKAWDSGHTTYDAPLEKYAYNVALYVGNANADGFETINASIYNLTAYSIIKELKAAGSVASNVKVNSLEFVNGKLTLDLSKEFASDVASCGTAGEYIKVGCVVNTFIDAFNVDTLTITVEGKSWESGHALYDGPLSRFQ
jgi:hypothetical protein